MNNKSQLQSYLIQQKGLYGNEIYLNSNVSGKTNQLRPYINNEKEKELNQYRISINLCKKCDLGYTRKNFVFGIGNPDANLMLVGEAPGEKEDLKGEPFIGRAGKLLDKILLAINKKRENDVYITNVLKCRPPNNRDPLISEIEKCGPYLLKQISIIKPKIILALGKIAGNALINKNLPIKEMRNQTYDYYGTPLRVTYHPAGLLRNPNFKKPAWEDFKWIRDYLN